MYHDRYDGWNAWHDLGWLFPLLLIALIAATVVVAARLATSRAAPAVMAVPPPAPPSTDRVLEQVRMRYAAGQIDRAEYSRLMRDLGGEVPPDPSPS